MKHCLALTSIVGMFALMMLTVSCANQQQPAPETPAARGQRDRVMSELHAARKMLLDAMGTISDEKFKEKMGESQPSPSEAVEALIIRERNLLTAMSSSELDSAVSPLENESLGKEERQRLAQESGEAMRTLIEGCVAKIGPSDFKVVPNPANLGKADLEQGFKVARDANIAFARESSYSFLRRSINDDTCGRMNLQTAMMLQAELTKKVAEMVAGAAK